MNLETMPVLTRELMAVMGACDIGPNFFTEQNLWGKPGKEVWAAMEAANMTREMAWWESRTKTEAYVRYVGKEITMTNTYQVFNPFTGQHTEYTSEEEARIAAVEISKQILETHKVSVCRVIQNEHGDAAWAAAEFLEPITVI